MGDGLCVCSTCRDEGRVAEDFDVAGTDEEYMYTGVCKCGCSHEEEEADCFWVQCDTSECNAWTLVTSRPECAGFSEEDAEGQSFECTVCAQFCSDDDELPADDGDGGDNDGDNVDKGADRKSKRRRVTRSIPSATPLASACPPRPPGLSTTPVDITDYTRGDWGVSDANSSIIDAIRSRPSRELSPGYKMIVAIDNMLMDSERNTGSDALDDAWSSLALVETTVAEVGGDAWLSRLNLSNPPDPEQSSLIETHYAPWGDLNYTNPRFARDKVDVDTNGCMRAGNQMIPGAMVRRGGHEYTENLASEVKKRLVFVDYAIVVCHKKKEKAELKNFCAEGLGIAVEDYPALAALLMAIHAKVRHLATNGAEKLAVMHSGKTPSEKLGVPPQGARAVDYCGSLLHLENFVDRRKLRGQILRNRSRTENCNAICLRFYSSIACIRDLLPDDLRLVQEWTGTDKMSEEELAEQAKFYQDMNAERLGRLHDIQRAGWRKTRRLSRRERLIFRPMKEHLDRIHRALKAAATNPHTASASDLEFRQRHQAENDRRKAKTIAALGMTKVTKSTRTNPCVTCRCVRETCRKTYESNLTIPSDRVGDSDRRIQVFRVDDNGKKVGDDPLYILAHVDAARNQLHTEGHKIRSIVNGTEEGEEGGVLPPIQHRYGREKRPQPLWLRYEPRREHMIVAPSCKQRGCQSNTEPTDSKLRVWVDYVKYSSLTTKWKRQNETELRELCESLGIIAKKSETQKELLAKLEEHYKTEAEINK